MSSSLLLIALVSARVLSDHLPSSTAPLPRAREVFQLDVGQGDSALVLAQGNSGLIDTGKENALSSADWLGIFAQRKITRLNWVFLTHLDEDHCGGIKKLATLLPVDCVETSQAELGSPRGIKFASDLRTLGIVMRSFEAACVPFFVFSPPIENRNSHSHANQHMGGMVVPLANGGAYINFGDAEKNDEIRMSHWATQMGILKMWPRTMKLSHHGSSTSSESEVLAEIQPTEAWISVGAGNPYGHPSLEVLQRIRSLTIPLRRTDQEGSLTTTSVSEMN